MEAGSGEKIYASKFVLRRSIPESIRPELLESLYKTTFNLGEAYMYLDLLRSLDDNNRDADNVGLLFIMAAICFSVSLRKVADRQSRRNIRRLITLIYGGEVRKEKLASVEEIYNKYSPFVDQFLVHQDEGKISDAPRVPGWDQNKTDLDRLAELLDEVASKTCEIYLKPQTEHKKTILSFEKMLNK